MIIWKYFLNIDSEFKKNEPKTIVKLKILEEKWKIKVISNVLFTRNKFITEFKLNFYHPIFQISKINNPHLDTF